MDERTSKYYATHSDEIAQRYDAIQTPLKRIMEWSFDRGMRVLDVGAGSGRDLSLLLQMGCDAYGVEPCDALRSAAIRRHPELLARVGPSALPNLGQPFGGNFDALLCSAVLMHLTRAEMLDAAISLRSVLKDGGKLLLSVPGERPGLDDNHRDSQGRLFTPIDPDYLQLLYERIGFFLLRRWESDDALARAGHSWRTFLFEARYPGSSRPLDQIEAILNRDRKTATYKLALFRALSENDLWNLVPTSPSANAAKSDKLPSRHLLFGRREAIIHSWEVLRFARKARFDHEASRIAGRSQLSEESWQNDLFLSVYNAVEFTAAQRGLERWHP